MIWYANRRRAVAAAKAARVFFCRSIFCDAEGPENINIKKEGEAVVELDQFKSILATYTEPLVEVRDSL